MSRDYKKAYPKDHFRYLYTPATTGNTYVTDEWCIDLKFPFIHHRYVSYVLHGEYWIEE